MYIGVLFFFFNDTATTEIYTLSLHDALPISEHERFRCECACAHAHRRRLQRRPERARHRPHGARTPTGRSEEHTSELQSRQYLVCRLLLEKKNKQTTSLTSGTTTRRTHRRAY